MGSGGETQGRLPGLQEVVVGEDFAIGCKAPDMANGRWTGHLRNILAGNETAVLSLTVGLSSPDRALLLFDWSVSKDTLTLGLKLRINFFSSLPHRLPGLAAHGAHDAQAAATECIQLWDAQRMAGDRIAGQHPLAGRLLAKPGRLCTMVERVSQGHAVVSMPELADIVLPWRFFSMLERSMEAKHSLAKNGKC
jgi:hypothetical protein